MADTVEQLRGLVLSATELREMTNWPSALIEDYLNIISNLLFLAEVLDIEVHQKLEEVPTDFTDGSVPFVSSGFLAEDVADFLWSSALKRLTATNILTDKLNFVIDADPDMSVEGTCAWDEDDHVFKFATGFGNIIQSSQELWGVGVNKTGGEALDGKVVYASGVQGLRLTYDYADAREAVKCGFVGVVTAPTASNAEGPVTTFGSVRNFDTTAWAVGTKLYIAADATGTLTSTPPSGPDFVVWVANVVVSHATQGEIFVSPRFDFSNGITFTDLYLNGHLSLHEQSADPADPAEGSSVMWMSDGTDTGDDGDILIKEQSGAVVEQISLKHKDFVPSSVTLNTGTLVSGTVADVQQMFDGNVYHVDEVTGVPGYDIEFNFTGIDRRPNFIVARWIYDGSTTHYVTIDAYNYTQAAWDQIRMFKTSETYYASMTMYFPQNIEDDYVDGSGNVMIRFYHQSSGNASHDIQIDYVGLAHSLQGVN